MNTYVYRHILFPAILILTIGTFYQETRMIFEIGDDKDTEQTKELDMKYWIFFVMLQTNFIVFQQSTGWIDVISIVIAFLYYYCKVKAANEIQKSLNRRKQN